MLDECLHNLVLVWQVRDHVCHVVFRHANESWAKNNGQVSWFHLEELENIRTFLKELKLKFLLQVCISEKFFLMKKQELTNIGIN